MGYHQVEVEPKDRFMTVFVTHRGLYIYNVMHFGLCNAPATFQRLIKQILETLIGCGVLVFLDDILIYAETSEELIDKLSQVLKLLAKAGLKCKAFRCSVFTKMVTTSDTSSQRKESIRSLQNWRKSVSGPNLRKELDLHHFWNCATTTVNLFRTSRTSVVLCTKCPGRVLWS